MADNVTADAGAGGATFRTDDDGTAHWPYTKIAFGPDNTQTVVASTATNPLPVALSDIDNAVLDTIDAVLDTINAKLVTGTIIGDVNANAGTNLNTSALLTTTNFTDVLGTTSLVTTGAIADAVATSQDVLNVRSFNYVYNGTTFDLMREGSEAGSSLVDLGVNNNVTIDSGTVTTVTTVTNLAQMGGVAISLNTGVRDTGTQRVTIATDDLVPVTGTITAVTSITNDVSIDDGGNSITVDGAISATLDAETTKVIGTVRMASGGVASGSFASGSIASGAIVDLPLPAGAATEATLGTIDTDTGNIATSVALIDNPIVAHAAAVSGSTGVAILGLEARSTEPTAVADAEATRGIATLLGKQVTVPYAIPTSTWSYAAASGGIEDTTGVTAKAAGAAGVINYITRVQVINGHATVNTDVQIRDGAAGTVLWRGFAQNSGGGASCVFDPPLRGTAATLVEVGCGTTSSATYFNLQGYQALE